MGFYAKKEGYKKPDVKAPRFRTKKHNPLNEGLFKRFRDKKPHLEIDYKLFKSIILLFNETLWNKVLENREGVEFPEQLGYLFIGTCPKAKDVTDPVTSAEYDQKLNHKNWHSNQYLCKIFYSNYGTKYRFANSSLWHFVPSRKFKRSASASFRKNWNRYIKVSPISKVSGFFKDKTIKSIKVKKHDYNRGVSFSDTQPE